MKTSRVLSALSVLLLAGPALVAQQVPISQAPAVGTLRTAQELEQLVGPIALYPDALIALILPASTAPADIVLAARHLRDFPGDRSQIEHRAWDESVKSLTHYGEVIKWMDENLQWTKQLGEAFTEQPADVMQSVQRLRAQARAAGTLIDTPQQQVISEPQVIRIVPAQPDVIYVPHYEPEVVFVDRPVYYSRPFMTFGAGVAVGSWLAFDCDWNRHSIWVGNRHRHWSGHDWRRPVVPIAPVAHGYVVRSHEVRQWHPAVQPARSSVSVSWQSRTTVVRPTSFGHSSSRGYTPRDHGSRDHRADDRRDGYPGTVSNSQQRAYPPDSRQDSPGTRVRSSSTLPVVPSLPMARNTPLPAVANEPAPAVVPSARAGSYQGGTRERDGDSRSRRPQAGDAPQTSAAPHVQNAPSLPMANSARSMPVHGPVAGPARALQTAPPNSNQSGRTYSQNRGHAPAQSVPNLPMASPAPARGAVMGPVAPAQAPAPAPAPAASVAAPAPAPATPARPEGDNRRGRRDQAHEH